MKKAILQLWEESTINEGVRPDGCSIHENSDLHTKFVSSIYDERIGDAVPDSYEKVVDSPFEVEISEALWTELCNNNGSLRLMQNSYHNLLHLEEIKIEDDVDFV